MQASPIKSALNAVRILVADDDQLNRSLLKAIFEAEGCRVTHADGGAVGLDAFAAEPIDIVIFHRERRTGGANRITPDQIAPLEAAVTSSKLGFIGRAMTRLPSWETCFYR